MSTWYFVRIAEGRFQRVSQARVTRFFHREDSLPGVSDGWISLVTVTLDGSVYRPRAVTAVHYSRQPATKKGTQTERMVTETMRATIGPVWEEQTARMFPDQPRSITPRIEAKKFTWTPTDTDREGLRAAILKAAKRPINLGSPKRK